MADYYGNRIQNPKQVFLPFIVQKPASSAVGTKIILGRDMLRWSTYFVRSARSEPSARGYVRLAARPFLSSAPFFAVGENKPGGIVSVSPAKTFQGIFSPFEAPFAVCCCTPSCQFFFVAQRSCLFCVFQFKSLPVKTHILRILTCKSPNCGLRRSCGGGGTPGPPGGGRTSPTARGVGAAPRTPARAVLRSPNSGCLVITVVSVVVQELFVDGAHRKKRALRTQHPPSPRVLASQRTDHG